MLLGLNVEGGDWRSEVSEMGKKNLMTVSEETIQD